MKQLLKAQSFHVRRFPNLKLGDRVQRDAGGGSARCLTQPLVFFFALFIQAACKAAGAQASHLPYAHRKTSPVSKVPTTTFASFLFDSVLLLFQCEHP